MLELGLKVYSALKLTFYPLKNEFLLCRNAKFARESTYMGPMPK